jgi:asparagine synthase (glutamine-hydrolysing)
MCGITGCFARVPDTDAALLEATVTRMATTLRHRGPDDAGTWIDAAAGIALGHRRLAVVDLSPLGHQPMHSTSGRYVIAFNGEIYNFRALRTALEPRGHAFRGHSDTEVMLAAITEWGVLEAVRRFNGMFAFALWDRHERTLHLARDRFGEKPLYYGWFGNTLLFASELKALRAHPQFRDAVDRDALALYMRYGYVPAPHSIYRQVRKLPPGTLLSVRSDAAEQLASYWSITETALDAIASPFAGTDEEAADALHQVLSHAVRDRLEADVPLGAFLSGGIDSSTIVALMQRHSAAPVRTFTVGFQDAAYNEADDAKRVARHLGTDHTELYVSAQDTLDVIPRLPALYDEPFADPSAVPTFLISSLARQHVTVSLSGDGGDELLGGYNRYALGTGTLPWLRRSPRPLRAALAGALQAVPQSGWDRLLAPLARRPGSKVHRLADILRRPGPHDAYSAVLSQWHEPRAVVLGASAATDATTRLPAEADSLDEVRRMMLLDARTYLPDDILVKVDRASMGVSLETRVPFLDPGVATFCWSLPLAMKIRGRERKWLLRRVLERYVPRALFERPKAGFAAPIGGWLRGPIRGWAEELLDASRLRQEGFFDPEQVRPVWAHHLSGKENAEGRLWCVLMFQSWLAAQRADAGVAA